MRPRKSINQINVVPYIDVMLVLLVIFMVTAPLINPGVVDLPSVGSKLSAPVAALEVSVRADLLARVQDRQAKNPDQPVVIAADAKVRYEEVIGVLDLLQRNGVRRVGLLLRPQQS
jgi:biopolymer transport protein TolR